MLEGSGIVMLNLEFVITEKGLVVRCQAGPLANAPFVKRLALRAARNARKSLLPREVADLFSEVAPITPTGEIFLFGITYTIWLDDAGQSIWRPGVYMSEPAKTFMDGRILEVGRRIGDETLKPFMDGFYAYVDGLASPRARRRRA